MLNCVELTSQEAAWYLLRQPMSQSSVKIIYILTSWPAERERVRKTNAELERAEIDGASCDIWKENLFDKYQKRPAELEDVTLAQLSAHYTFNKGEWKKREHPRIIRYRNYDAQGDNNNYKREMVTLHLPFRDEKNDVLAEHKYIQLYDGNDVLIMQRRHEFESSLDIAKTLEICRNLCIENDADNQTVEDLNAIAARALQTDAFDMFLRDPNVDVNADIRSATLSRLGAIVRKRDNIMPKERFISLMRQTNTQQKGLLLHVIDHIIDSNSEKEAIQIFLTGPAGCGKTFVIHLLKEIYNRFTNVEMPFNSFLTCASTGKAAVAIDGTTIHTAFKIAIARESELSFEVLQQFRSLFKFISTVIIDEISMVSAELNEKVDSRLRQITGSDTPYGGRDMYLIGDLRQLPPVRSTPIYKQTRQSLAGPTVWRSLQFYELKEVMRQSNSEFSNLLPKSATAKF